MLCLFPLETVILSLIIDSSSFLAFFIPLFKAVFYFIRLIHSCFLSGIDMRLRLVLSQMKTLPEGFIRYHNTAYDDKNNIEEYRSYIAKDCPQSKGNKTANKTPIHRKERWL